MKRLLITTTINDPAGLEEWAAQLQPEDYVVIAGDRKTPHDAVVARCNQITTRYGVNTLYLAPDAQRIWNVSGWLGWNCIQRRSIALLEGLRTVPDADYVITVDDDNFPSPDWIATVDDIFSGMSVAPIASDNIHIHDRWFNAASILLPEVSHRGLPLDVRHRNWKDIEERVSDRSPEQRTGVFASLWLGEPDIDAVERICCAPTVTGMRDLYSVALGEGTWCPFNSQATAFLRCLAPAQLMWPHVGRYDDIWASYLTQAVMAGTGLIVEYGEPLVRQDRNPHDLLIDLGHEMFGMVHNNEVIDVLRTVMNYVSPTDMSIVERVRYAFAQLSKLSFFDTQTYRAFLTWADDIDHLTQRYGVTFEVPNA